MWWDPVPSRNKQVAEGSAELAGRQTLQCVPVLQLQLPVLALELLNPVLSVQALHRCLKLFRRHGPSQLLHVRLLPLRCNGSTGCV